MSGEVEAWLPRGKRDQAARRARGEQPEAHGGLDARIDRLDEAQLLCTLPRRHRRCCRPARSPTVGQPSARAARRAQTLEPEGLDLIALGEHDDRRELELMRRLAAGLSMEWDVPRAPINLAS